VQGRDETLHFEHGGTLGQLLDEVVATNVAPGIGRWRAGC
jgi:hypothetical protein